MLEQILTDVVAEARLAPSIHNAQPVRWSLDGDGLRLSLDPARRVPRADPTGGDARLSGGAAVWGTRVALARRGLGVRAVEIDGDAALLTLGGDLFRPPSAEALACRVTHRSGFREAFALEVTALKEALMYRVDAHLLPKGRTFDALSELNDATSLQILRDRAFRSELRSWMRLDPGHPDWARDGLSAEALGIPPGAARMAGVTLGFPVFETMDLLGQARRITDEATRTAQATAMVVFHRPEREDRWASGAAYYELLIALTRAGFATWPMAALTSDRAARVEVARRISLPVDRVPILVLRVGPLPPRVRPKARLPVDELIEGLHPRAM